MKTFKQYITEKLILEAIPLNKAKEIMGNAGDSYKTLFDDVFKGKNRIILSQTISYRDVALEAENTPSSLYSKIQHVLYENGYEMDGYHDYVHNKCYKDSDIERKQPIKIGKVLTKLDEDNLLQGFTVDPTRIKDDYKILISKHPYDIAGISTDRNWTSCMDLGTDRINYKGKPSNEGVYSDSIKLYIRNNAMVAYLVSDDDKNKYGKYTLKRPIARILIYPFKGTTDEGEEKYAYHPSSQIYGVDIKPFYNKVKTWVYDKLNTDIEEDLVYSKIENAYYDGLDDEPDFRTELSPEEIAKQYDFTYVKYTTNTLNEFADNSLWDVYIEIPFDMKNPDIILPSGKLNVDDIIEEIAQNELINYTSIDKLFDHPFEAFYSIKNVGGHIEFVLPPIKFYKMIDSFNDLFENDGYNEFRGAFEVLSIIDNQIKNNIDLEGTISSGIEYAQDLIDEYIKDLDSEEEFDLDTVDEIIRNAFYE